MRFIDDQVTFGRHETFALRYGWLSKGFHAVSNDPDIFSKDEATVTLGVGKNMVKAIRYWLKATQMVHPTTEAPTPLGERIFKNDTSFDPYLEDEGTLWLIHWLLATNATSATSWFWFFNKFHKQEFTSKEVEAALKDFVNESVLEKKRAKPATLQKDVQLLTRMYSQSKTNDRTPLEEVLDSPLANLQLITETSSARFQSKPASRPSLPLGIFGFAVAQLFEKKSKDKAQTDGEITLPLEDFNSSGSSKNEVFASPGCVFRLSESDLMDKLEQLVAYIPNKFEIRSSAGIQQISKIGDIERYDYLKKYYLDDIRGVAA